jgi:hypothetical protein
LADSDVRDHSGIVWAVEEVVLGRRVPGDGDDVAGNHRYEDSMVSMAGAYEILLVVMLVAIMILAVVSRGRK